MRERVNQKFFLLSSLLFLFLFVLAGCSSDLENNSGNNTENNELTQSVFDSGELVVHYLDVGQGNAILIEKNEHFMLIDGGVNEYSSFVVSYLQKQGVKSLDYVIISHYDADHLAGVIGALHVFPADCVIGPDYEGDTRLYESFQILMREKGYTVEHPNPGDTYSFEGVRITAIAPAYYGHQDPNEDSVGILLEDGENSFLFCGDIGIESEAEIVEAQIPIQADVFLVNHHGSQGANSEEFIDAVNPQYAIISCGKGNSYGHPREIVLERLIERNITIFRTDTQGTILIGSDGHTLTFSQPPTQEVTPGDEDLGEIVQTEDCTYVLNKSSKKYHYPECSGVKSMKEENKERFSGTKEQVEKRGYESCGLCKP